MFVGAAGHQHRSGVGVTHVVGAPVADSQQLEDGGPVAAPEGALVRPRGVIARVLENFASDHLGVLALPLKRPDSSAIELDRPYQVGLGVVFAHPAHHSLFDRIEFGRF